MAESPESSRPVSRSASQELLRERGQTPPEESRALSKPMYPNYDCESNGKIVKNEIKNPLQNFQLGYYKPDIKRFKKESKVVTRLKQAKSVYVQYI